MTTEPIERIEDIPAELRPLVLTHITAARQVTDDQIRWLRGQLADATDRGYQKAIATLVNDEQYLNWLASDRCQPDRPVRQYLADYLTDQRHPDSASRRCGPEPLNLTDLPDGDPVEVGGLPARDRIAPAATVDAMTQLGGLVLDLGRVDRITYHQDGVTAESVTDHTVMLGLTACAVAERYFPDLDLGFIAQYALIHDVVEVHAGDTPTLRMLSTDQAAAKQQREDAAHQQIHRDFAGTLPWLPDTISEYEQRASAEARFVRAVDKLLPKITHILNHAATMREQGVSAAEVTARYETQLTELRAYAADFPALFALRTELVGRVAAVLEAVAQP